MSIFNEQVTPENNSSENQNDTNGQTQSQETETKGLLEELVGEGKKFKSVEDLAKGKLEADKFIPELQRQIEELKADLAEKDKNDYAKQLLQLLQKQGTSSSNVDSANHNNNNAGTNEEDNTTSPNSGIDIETLVEQALQKKETQSKIQSNIQLVEQTLTEKFGTEAQSVLKQKSEELGLSLAKMQEIATESPNAFLSLIGEAPVKNQTLTKGTVNTAALPNKNNGDRNNSYYQKLRRENKSVYYSAQIQRQMMEDAAKLGDKFYI